MIIMKKRAICIMRLTYADNNEQDWDDYVESVVNNYLCVSSLVGGFCNYALDPLFTKIFDLFYVVELVKVVVLLILLVRESIL